MNLFKGKFARHMMSALIAQGLSLLQSTFMTFIVAKILDQTVFAWWQWFLFLAGLTHYIHIGVGEGVLLKYGGTPYSELDHSQFSNEYKGYTLLQLLCAIIICAIGFLKFGLSEEGICIILTGFYLVSYNLTYYLSQVLIASNRTSDYSKAVILDKSVLFISSIILIAVGYRDYLLFAILYTFGQYIELFVCSTKTKEIVRPGMFNLKKSFQTIFGNASQGFFLSLSTFLANQITGVGRLCIRIFNGLLDFGVLSIANSLCNFLLIFVRQIGMVIFPFLRESNEERRRNLYPNLIFAIEITTLAALLLYYPFRLVLGKWLYKYSDSFIYMAYIMPIIVLDSQMSALNTPYLNTMRKERILLLINAFSLLVTIICTILSIKVFDSIELVALSISIGMATKNYLSYFYICKMFGILDLRSTAIIFLQFVLLSCFVITARNFSFSSMIVYGLSYITYCLLRMKDIKKCINSLKRISS